jgi:hypothetical protein
MHFYIISINNTNSLVEFNHHFTLLFEETFITCLSKQSNRLSLGH